MQCLVLRFFNAQLGQFRIGEGCVLQRNTTRPGSTSGIGLGIAQALAHQAMERQVRWAGQQLAAALGGGAVIAASALGWL